MLSTLHVDLTLLSDLTYDANFHLHMGPVAIPTFRGALIIITMHGERIGDIKC